MIVERSEGFLRKGNIVNNVSLTGFLVKEKETALDVIETSVQADFIPKVRIRTKLQQGQATRLMKVPTGPICRVRARASCRYWLCWYNKLVIYCNMNSLW